MQTNNDTLAQVARPFDLFDALRRQLRLFVLVPVLAVLAGFAYLVVTPSGYSSFAMVEIDTAGLGVDQENTLLNSHVVNLRSEATAEAVITFLGFEPGPDFSVGPGRLEGIILTLREQFGLQARIEGTLSEATVRSMVARQIAEGLVVGRIPFSNQLLVRYTSNSPENAAEIVNAFVEVYVDAVQERVRTRAATQAEFLRARADEVRVLAAAAYSDVQEARIAAEVGIVDPQEVSRQISRLTEELSDIDQSLAAMQVQVAFIMPTDDLDRLETAAASVEGGLALFDTFVETSSRLDDLQARDPSSSTTAQLEASVVRARTALDRLLRLEQRTLERDLAVMQAQRENLIEQLDLMLARKSREDRTEIRMAEQQAEVLRGVYAGYVEEIQETFQRASLTPIRIITPARPPLASSTSEKLVLLIALMFGLVLATALAAFREWRAVDKALVQVPSQPAP